MSDFKLGHEVMRPNSGDAYAGFNRRVHGSDYAEAFQYQNERQNGAMVAGFWLADRMINDGKLFYVHPFHQLECPQKGHAFQYGGTWVCNSCGQPNVQREWWKIKVQKDGNAWCCVGTGFENLQESDNYAFGDTRDEAIENYGRLMAPIRDGSDK